MRSGCWTVSRQPEAKPTTRRPAPGEQKGSPLSPSFKALIEAGVDVNEANKYSRTPLHSAASLTKLGFETHRQKFARPDVGDQLAQWSSVFTVHFSL